MKLKAGYILLFDGECNFCNFWVSYVIKRDKGDIFRFATIQSNVGQKYIEKLNIDRSIDSVILIVENRYYLKSTAALKIMRGLGGIQSAVYFFIVVPKFIRDFFYDLVARNRYRLFGKQACLLMNDKSLRHKFIQA